MSESVSYQSLRDCFAAIFDGAAKDPVEHILALTYEFDDQQLLNLLAGRPLDEKFEPRAFDLRRISALAPVVIYDARKTKAANLVPHFMELLPVGMPPYSCHHSKAYLVATRDRVHLMLGSMNLTHTGLFSNREVFRDFRCSASQTADVPLISDFVDLIANGHEPSASLSAIVRGVRAKLAAWPAAPDPGSARLVSSGYEGQPSGLAQLAALWRERFAAFAPQQVFVASPFFDRGATSDVMASLLQRTFGECGELRVVTDVACMAVLSQRHFAGMPGILQCIAEQIDPQERRRIEMANDGISTGDLVLRRKLHAKVLILRRGDACLVYTGSANFTCKAWDGTNRELGVAWWDNEAGAQCDRIASALHAKPEDRLPELPAVPLNDVPEEDEDYQELVGYPDFVRTIELRACDHADGFAFKILGQQLDQLEDYEISWGQERLQFAQGVSQPLSASTLFARLLGGRNLRFRARAMPQRTYFLPFRHAAELFEQRESHLHPSAEDWMLHHLRLDSYSPVELDEFVPGEEHSTPDNEVPSMDVDREQNVVIRMQRYLTLFAQIETEFHERGQRIAGLPDIERVAQWKATVSAPLLTFAAVLSRSPAQPAALHAEHSLFQVGELVLMAKDLEYAFQQDQSLSRAIAEHLPASVVDPLQADYLLHCRHFNDH